MKLQAGSRLTGVRLNGRELLFGEAGCLRRDYPTFRRMAAKKTDARSVPSLNRGILDVKSRLHL
jgi:hypothetical protein